MKPSKNLYLKLYLFWAIWVSLRSVFFALILSIFSALSIYISKGFPSFSVETLLALKEIAIFSFPISFSLSFILMLLLVFKALFSKNIDGVIFKLYDCKDEIISKPLLSDVVIIWRKWLFVTVWTILIFMVLCLGLFKLISGDFPPLSWFNGISLYILIMLLGGAVFVTGIKSCKKIRTFDE